MQRQGNLYTFGFAFLICVLCSVILAVAASALKPKQDIEARLDIVKNILSVAGYDDAEIQKKKPTEVIEIYRKNFEAVFLNKDNKPAQRSALEEALMSLGYTQENLTKIEGFEVIDIFNRKLHILASRAGKSVADYDPGYKLLFLYKPTSAVEAYIVPAEGNGLWGMIYSYVALEPDLNTIKGIRFYKHIETPGLGGECEKPWFTGQYVGKKILDPSGNLVSVGVVKGKVSDSYSSAEDLSHHVDGISGATITGKGITTFLKEDLGRYNPYFQQLRTAQ